jgi:hypothetical protein
MHWTPSPSSAVPCCLKSNTTSFEQYRYVRPTLTHQRQRRLRLLLRGGGCACSPETVKDPPTQRTSLSPSSSSPPEGGGVALRRISSHSGLCGTSFVNAIISLDRVVLCLRGGGGGGAAVLAATGATAVVMGGGDGKEVDAARW